MESYCCPICGCTHFEDCLHFQDIPVFANVTAESREQAQTSVCGSLNIVMCKNCGFVFNTYFKPELVQYSQDYLADIGLSKAYQELIRQASAFIQATYPLDQGLVVEVGCGTGFFLKFLQKEWGDKFTFLGVDPSVHEPSVGNLSFCNCLFNEDFLKTLPQDIKLIVNRHMIEHMVNPLGVLRLFAQALPEDGMIYLETPRLDWILENKAFFDFGYEHCAYFSDIFMLRLLDAANLHLVALEKSFNGQYFSICAKKRAVASVFDPTHVITPATAMELVKTKQGFKNLMQCYNSKLKTFHVDQRCCVWGCSQKGEIFLNLFDTQLKCSVVDINKRKQGRFVLGTGHKILAPEQLKELAIDKILVMNANYLEEIKALFGQICPEKRVIFETV